jgi:hypothetical protein
MWTKPKPILVEDLPKQIHREGQLIADISVCISYSTGEPLFYVVSVNSTGIKDYAFMTLEEAIVFCDLHNIYVDTVCWSTLGLVSFYTTLRAVKLENGSTYVLPDGA